LFFRNHNRTYIRNVHVNHADDLSAVQDLVGEERARQFRPSQLFVPVPEVIGAFQLLREFQERGVLMDTGIVWRESHTAATVKNFNVIALGSPRTNVVIKEFQQGERYFFTDECLEVRDPRDGEAPTYKDEDGSESLSDMTWFAKYAVVTRKANLNREYVVTAIAHNHARAAQGVIDFFTTHLKESYDLLDRLRLERSAADSADDVPAIDELPEHFQIIFRVLVSIERGETEIGDIQPVVCRLLVRNQREIVVSPS
jgi:hypothetical protein